MVACLCFVLSGIPTLWDYWLQINESIPNDFLSTALVMIASVAAAVGLVFLGRRLEGPHPLRGLHAGSVIAALLFLVIFVVVFDWIGGSLAARQVDLSITWLAIAALGGALLFGVYWLFHRPGFAKFLVNLEDNGWFSTSAFKFNQGQRVRRATLIALLIIVAGGILGGLRTGLYGKGNWEMAVPGTDYALVALFNKQYMIPFLIFCGCAWLAWRSVNWPTFADFLIATEAEMNKVSWTTRKRLVQDTIVVLVTVFLLTVFLFVVDIIWIRVLSLDPFPGVLQVNLKAKQQAQQAPTEW